MVEYDKDAIVYPYITEYLRKEIPDRKGILKELEEYAENVLVRFSNPYIKHFLSSIALNSVSKFRVRVLPSILEYKKRFGTYPGNLVFGFSKLIEFYKVGTPNDDADAVSALRDGSLCEILSNVSLWGEDLSDMCEVIKNANPSL